MGEAFHYGVFDDAERSAPTEHLDRATTRLNERMLAEVQLAAGTTVLDVSVDGSADFDPKIGILEGTGCNAQGINACSNDSPVNECEYLRGDSVDGDFFGTSTYVVVSESLSSSTNPTVRFQIDP